MSLKGKTLFITGGSRGIGLAIALRAARDGANVAIAAKTKSPHPTLEGTIYTAAEEIEKAGGQALPLVVDVRDEAAVKDAIDQTAARFGTLDIVVNNASAISLTPVTQTDMKRFDLMHQINARGTFMVSKYAIAHLEKAANPHILMMSPPLDMAEKWFASHTGYTMAKFGMSMVVLGLASCAPRVSRSTRYGRAPPSRPRRSGICSVATPSCACRASRRFSPTPPI
jgi:citronellol/citronellal dehydrogenase